MLRREQARIADIKPLLGRWPLAAAAFRSLRVSSPLLPTLATVQARVIASDDGRVLAARTAQASKAHIDELVGGALAIKDASQEVATGLIADLQAAWQARAAGGTQSLTLTIAGLVSYRHLTAVKQYLESGLPGVKGVDVRQFAQGSAELGLDYAGKSAAVAEHLANRKFTGFRLKPISVTPNRIDIQAVLEK